MADFQNCTFTFDLKIRLNDVVALMYFFKCISILLVPIKILENKS